MASQPTLNRTEAIAQLNDRARLGRDRKAKIGITRSCIAAFADPGSIEGILIQSALMKAFAKATFSEDSPERDFASIEFNGRKIWMKIDYYDNDMIYGSDDPTNPDVTIRLITIMLPEDY